MNPQTAASAAAMIARLPKSELLSSADLSAAFGCSDKTIREFVESGELSGINLGTGARASYRITRASAVELIKRRCF